MKNIVADLRKNIVIITLPVTILTNLIFGGLAFTAAKDERRSAHGISIDENGKVKKSLEEHGELPSFVREALPILEEGKKWKEGLCKPFRQKGEA
jgi:hypothetical protein